MNFFYTMLNILRLKDYTRFSFDNNIEWNWKKQSKVWSRWLHYCWSAEGHHEGVRSSCLNKKRCSGHKQSVKIN